jgi:SAM-dependent methyltransferase
VSPELTLRVENLDECPICSSPSFEVKLVLPDFLYGVPGNFTYCECRECRTVFQNPRVLPADLHLCYPDSYYTHRLIRSGQVRTSDTWQDRLRWKILGHADARIDRNTSIEIGSAIAWILSHSSTIRRRARFGLSDALGLDVPGKRCLEIGPGTGTDLRLLAHLGWAVEGLEFDPIAAAVAGQTSGCDVRCGSLESCNLPSESFDLIYGSHVVEHLVDVVSSLDRVFGLLRPGGRLLMIYPNRDSLVARHYGRYAPTWDSPRHISLLPAATMAEVLRRVGFHRVKVEAIGKRVWQSASIAQGVREKVEFSGDRINPALILSAVERLAPARWRLGEELAAIATRPGAR